MSLQRGGEYTTDKSSTIVGYHISAVSSNHCFMEHSVYHAETEFENMHALIVYTSRKCTTIVGFYGVSLLAVSINISRCHSNLLKVRLSFKGSIDSVTY
jgi:hypothetical protein